MREGSFKDAVLTAANFSGAKFVKADIVAAKLSQADFSGASLQRATLTMLRDAAGPSFAAADMRGAVLTDSVMPDASFARADLTGVRVEDVTLERADFRGAVGLGSVFWLDARLPGSNFAGSRLDGLSFDGQLQVCRRTSPQPPASQTTRGRTVH
mmetsp:Transcript_12634/g.42486  ORF Transcript_12634/g.42486 Transcript_12634/m.42486 type:complete len:155 (-) Transcript_12634:156-620(-)